MVKKNILSTPCCVPLLQWPLCLSLKLGDAEDTVMLGRYPGEEPYMEEGSELSVQGVSSVYNMIPKDSIGSKWCILWPWRFLTLG